MLRGLVLAAMLAAAAYRFLVAAFSPQAGVATLPEAFAWFVLVVVSYRLLSRHVARLGGFA